MSFVLGVTLVLTLAASARASPAGLQPFSLADVDLHQFSDFAENAALNHDYLLLLDPDNLLYNFRVTAGLPAPGQSYGGWEGPTVEVRGQFIGHYLSALAFAFTNTREEAFLNRSNVMVAGLVECQEAWGDGYVAAFPKSFIDRLEALQPVWAPLYVIHKLMAGLLAQHQLVGQPHALKAVTGMADYFCGRFTKVVAVKGTQHWLQMLETEFGGMNEVLYQLHVETGDPATLECAHLFDKPSWYQPLVEGQDVMAGRHANTHLAQVNGFAARYDATGDPDAAVAVGHFFATALERHSYSSGGSNWFEFWHEPRSLGDAVSNLDAGANAQESCTQYNILKIARSLFRWTRDPGVADFYERAILNGVLGIQRRPHSHAPSRDEPSHYHARLHAHSHSHSHALTEHALALDGLSLAVDALQTTTTATARIAATAAADALRGSAMQPHEAAMVNATNALHQGPHVRPADYRVVSWPDDPAVRGAPGGGGGGPGGGAGNAPGVYIYYMPLAPGLWRGDNGHVWTKGWGERFNSFWCCYGTAIESFSKLADSIYFHSPPPAHASEESSHKKPSFWARLAVKWAEVASHSHTSGPSSSAVPELYVNQLVSSTLRWHQLGLTLTQRAELYSTTDNVARVTLGVAFNPPPSRVQQLQWAHSSGGGKGRNASFVLQWRVPSWTDVQRMQVTLNGREIDVAALQAAGAAGGGGPDVATGRPGFNPPKFGQGAAFVPLASEFPDGSVVEVAMPMHITTEDVNDARPDMQSLKAVIMGPFLMAGLTDGPNDVDIDPAAIEQFVSLPNATGLVSLTHADGSDSLLVRQPGGSGVQFQAAAALTSRAAAMDATFRVVPALDGASGDSLERTSQLISLESMSRPGHYLTLDERSGGLVLHNLQLPSAGEKTASFVLSGEGSAASVSRVQLQPLDSPQALLHLVQPAAAQYPKGARLLKGRHSSYLLVPMGQIVDEHYTAYFRFGPAPTKRFAEEGRRQRRQRRQRRRRHDSECRR